mgnify:CR=1 FL=1
MINDVGASGGGGDDDEAHHYRHSNAEERIAGLKCRIMRRGNIYFV